MELKCDVISGSKIVHFYWIYENIYLWRFAVFWWRFAVFGDSDANLGDVSTSLYQCVCQIFIFSVLQALMSSSRGLVVFLKLQRWLVISQKESILSGQSQFLKAMHFKTSHKSLCFPEHTALSTASTYRMCPHVSHPLSFIQFHPKPRQLWLVSLVGLYVFTRSENWINEYWIYPNNYCTKETLSLRSPVLMPAMFVSWKFG